MCRSDPSSSTAIGYYYITDKDRPEDIVRSLVRQISGWHRVIPEALANLYDQYRKDRQFPTTGRLFGSIPHIVEGFQEGYVVLDALDECTDRKAILDLVEGIVGWKLENLRVLVSSRNEHDIGCRLEHLISDSIDIQSHSGEDIEIYLHRTFETDNRTLLEGANGM